MAEECAWSSRPDHASAGDILGLLLPEARDKLQSGPLVDLGCWAEIGFDRNRVSMESWEGASLACFITQTPKSFVKNGSITSRTVVLFSPRRLLRQIPADVKRQKCPLKEMEVILTFSLMTGEKRMGEVRGQTSDGNGRKGANEGERGSNETCKNQMKKAK